VQQAEQQLVSANAQIGVAKSAMFPTISLTGFYGGESTALWTLLNNGASIWSIGFGLSLPVFDGGRYGALTDAAVARDHQTLAGYQKAVETAFREVADALVSVQQTSSAEVDYQTGVDAARRALRLSRMRYEAGYSPYLEVLDAQRTANVSELAALRNRQALLSATVDLMKALGGGWSADQVSMTPSGPSGRHLVRPRLASSSARSFSGWPACPFTQCQLTRCLPATRSSSCHKSTFFTGFLSAVRQPRRFQSGSHSLILSGRTASRCTPSPCSGA